MTHHGRPVDIGLAVQLTRSSRSWLRSEILFEECNVRSLAVNNLFVPSLLPNVELSLKQQHCHNNWCHLPVHEWKWSRTWPSNHDGRQMPSGLAATRSSALEFQTTWLETDKRRDDTGIVDHRGESLPKRVSTPTAHADLYD